MCKTGKINFYEFIWFYWEIKKIITYFFSGLPVGGTK